jgi:hypothetical protein
MDWLATLELPAAPPTTRPHLAVEVGAPVFALLDPVPMSDQQQRRQWKIRDTMFSPWRELPGHHTATEIWERRSRGEFKVAVPVVENGRNQATAGEFPRP